MSTYDIEQRGQAHAPSAVRDLKDRGVAVTRVGYIEVGGKRRGLYQLDPDGSRSGLSGRTQISKRFKDELLAYYGCRCRICTKEFVSRALQPDHRVPQRIGGDEPDRERRVENYMPLCGPDNRAKSYECEHCPNWLVMDPDVCLSCYWAYPEDYQHVAMRPERRMTLVFQGDEEVSLHDAVIRKTGETGTSPIDFIRDLLQKRRRS